MRLLKSLLLGTIVSTVLGQDAPVCPDGWAVGQNKCYKENISKVYSKGKSNFMKKIDFRIESIQNRQIFGKNRSFMKSHFDSDENFRLKSEFLIEFIVIFDQKCIYLPKILFF